MAPYPGIFDQRVQLDTKMQPEVVRAFSAILAPFNVTKTFRIRVRVWVKGTVWV